MEGVILFADDHIYSVNRAEKLLFESLRKDLPALGVHNLELASEAIKSIGTFKALVLDWQYSEEDNFDDIAEELGEDRIKVNVAQKEDAAFKFLLDNNFYSLIYIFSEIDIEELHGDALREKFGDRIKIKKKDENFSADNIEQFKKEIIDDIQKWEQDNKNLHIPILWSQSINQAMQKIFLTLYSADPNWIVELYRTASTDPVTPSVEVINLFQSLLAENIIQDKKLNDQITEVSQNGDLNNPEDFAKVIRILYYGKVLDTAPFMTGDIIRLSEDEYGIIITPECDIRHVITNPDTASFELLCFKQGDYSKSNFKLEATIKATPIIDRAAIQKNVQFSREEKQELSQLLNSQIKEADSKLQVIGFTQTKPRFHILPCFEFEPGNYAGIVQLDFRTGLSLRLGNSITVENRVGKLNTPYIQDLRQRYFSYKGRIGVPGHSRKLRDWLLGQN